MRTTYGTIVLLAAVWVVAAYLRPDATFHLGPLILPLVPLVTVPKHANTVPGILFGWAVGALVIASLWLTSLLDGPALGPFSSATSESVAVLIGASIVGLISARLTR